MADDTVVDDVAKELRDLGAKDATRAMQRAYPDADLPAVVPGPTRVELHPDDVLKVAQLNLTVSEAASHFGVSLATMKRRLQEPAYRQAWEQGRDVTRRSLRLWQIQKAKGGDTTMLIWLGKQLLDQKDRPSVEINVEAGAEVAIDMDDFEKLMDDLETEVLEAEYELVDDGPDVCDGDAGVGGGTEEG